MGKKAPQAQDMNAIIAAAIAAAIGGAKQTVAAKAAPGEAEARKFLTAAKYVETRFSDKGNKPYAVMEVDNGTRKFKLCVWL